MERLSTKASIPGAMVALTIGDTLFHHAEPDQKALSTLHGNLLEGPATSITSTATATSVLQPTVRSGPGVLPRAKAETTLSESAKVWPGLYRVVHGHTPTTSVPDFDAVQGPLRSTTVSYGTTESTSPTRRRIESMRTRDDPLRIPTGMRVTQSRPGRSLENVIRHNHDEHVDLVAQRHQGRAATNAPSG